jgi:hypothetical protein
VNRNAGHIASATRSNQEEGVYIRIPGQQSPKSPKVRNVRRVLAAHMVNDTSDDNI